MVRLRPKEPIMNEHQIQAALTRIACLLASLAITIALIGSQLGIAHRYAQQADAMLAAKNAPQRIVQQNADKPRLGS
jgi:hypothetical protein